MKIAFVGMGVMGGPMAANISKSGIDVTVYNRTTGRPGEEIAQRAGACIANTISEAVENADLIALCLGDENSVEEILLGKDGVVEHCSKDSTVVDFTTIGPEAAKSVCAQLGRRNIRYIDAPVTGGQPAAESGALTIMVGSDKNVSPKVRKVLEAVGTNLVFCGSCGSGNALKLINQSLCVTNLVGVGEALKLGKTFGISPENIVSACGGGAASSWQLSNLAIRAISGDFAPGFRVQHMRKDLRLLASADGTDLGPAAKHAKDLFDQLIELSADNESLGTQALLKLYT